MAHMTDRQFETLDGRPLGSPDCDGDLHVTHPETGEYSYLNFEVGLEHGMIREVTPAPLAVRVKDAFRKLCHIPDGAPLVGMLSADLGLARRWSDSELLSIAEALYSPPPVAMLKAAFSVHLGRDITADEIFLTNGEDDLGTLALRNPGAAERFIAAVNEQLGE